MDEVDMGEVDMGEVDTAEVGTVYTYEATQFIECTVIQV